MRARIAALLPLPAFLKRRLLPEAEGEGGAGASLSNWSSMAAQYAEPMSGWAKAATVAATVALAGAGAGVATSQGDSEPAAREPALAAPAAVTPGGQATSTATTSAGRSSATRGGSTTQERSTRRPSGGDRPASAASRGGASDAGASDRGGSGSGERRVRFERRRHGCRPRFRRGRQRRQVHGAKAVSGATGTVDQVTTTTGRVVEKATAR